LAVAIEAALLSNFALGEAYTFHLPDAPAFGPGAAGRLARYAGICVPGAVLNFVVTLLCVAFGKSLVTAAVAGVVAGGALNLLMNIPAIWRTWERAPSSARMTSK